METSNKPRPMMIRSPNGHLFPVQSIRACATRLGQILRYVSGEDRKFMSWQGLQNLLQAGVTTFSDGHLKGWSFYACKDDQEQIDAFMTNLGIPSGLNTTTTQEPNTATTQESNTAITQTNNGTTESLWDDSELTVTSDWVDPTDKRPTELDASSEFDRLFCGIM